jgi:hypothetical protein
MNTAHTPHPTRRQRLLPVLLAIPIVLLFSLLLLQTPWARQQCIRYMTAATNVPTKLIIGRLTGFLPFQVIARDITLGDSAGVWACIDRCEMNLNWPAAFRGQLLLDDVAVRQIDWLRRPLENRTRTTGEAAMVPTGFPVSFARLHVERFRLGPVAGIRQPVYELTGNVRSSAHGGTVWIHLSAHAIATHAPGPDLVDLALIASRTSTGITSSVEVDLAGGGENAHASARVHSRPDELRIDDLLVTSTPNSVEGSLRFMRGRSLPTGSLRLAISDLAPVGHLLDLPFAGSLLGTLGVTGDSTLRLTTDLTIDRLVTPWFGIDRLDATLDWPDLRRDDVAGHLQAGGITGGSIQLAHLSASATPDAGRTLLSLAGDGRHRAQPFSINTTGSAWRDTGALHLVLQDFVAADDHQALQLQAESCLELLPPPAALAGRITLTRVDYENLDLNTVLRGTNLVVNMASGRVSAADIVLTDEDRGRISLTAEVRMRPGEPRIYSLGGALHNVNMSRRDDVTAVVSGSFSITGGMDRLLIDGDWKVNSAAVDLAGLLHPLPTTLRRPSQPEQPVKDLPVSFTGTIRVDVPESLRIKGRTLDSTWGGRIQIENRQGSLALTGQLDATRGNVTFFNRNFQLTDGHLRMAGPLTTFPNMDITAESIDPEITARVHLRGPLNAPDMSLDSLPSLPQDEILSRVLFGKALATVTPMQALKVAVAAHSMASGGNTLSLMDRTRDILGVDQLEFQEKDAAASVIAGKQLSRHLYLEGSRSFGTPPETGVKAAYDLTRHISMEADAGTGLMPGVGVRWQHDY